MYIVDLLNNLKMEQQKDRTSQKTITLFGRHFDLEFQAKQKAESKNKKFKTSEFFRWALENKTEEYIESLAKKEE